MAKTKTYISRFTNFIWLLFLNGLLTILPITLTIALFNVSIKLILSWLEPIHAILRPTPLDNIPYFEVILVLLFIIFIGILLKIFILRSLIHTVEQIFFKIPLIRPIYSGIKQLIQAFSIQDKLSFKKVVIVEFPGKNLFSIGFLTSELPQSLSPNTQEKFFSIFIPTTPNPTSGFLVVLAEQHIKIINLTRQEAMAMIISGGIIQPERFSE